jgi:hypothetical protein
MKWLMIQSAKVSVSAEAVEKGTFRSFLSRCLSPLIRPIKII